MQQPVTDDDIFFGSERCFFRPAPGHSEEFTSTADYHFTLPTSSSHIETAELGLSEGPKIVVPRVPAMDILPIKDVFKSNAQNSFSKSFPDIFRVPLMKCPEDHPECLREVYGVKSGIRSGLLKYKGSWYRLKGCGNNDEGFIVRVHEFPDSASWQEILGCAFYSTSHRELFYTNLLSTCSTLKSRAIVSANEAVGLSYFTDSSQALFGTSPQVKPVCILERTLGDRRLGTHVLAGLQLILPLLLDTESIDANKLAKVFPSNRPKESLQCDSNKSEVSPQSFLLSIVSTDRFICDYCLGTSLGRDSNNLNLQGLSWPDIPRDTRSLANMLSPGHALPERTPSREMYPRQWSNSGPIDMSPRWQAIWDEVCHDLTCHLDKLQCMRNSETNMCTDNSTPVSEVLAYLYACIGYDAGNFLRGLHEKRMSWGTFQDEMCRIDLDEWHCNSHSNNFVMLPPNLSLPFSGSDHQPFLSFLDLDMAHCSDTFVDKNCDDNKGKSKSSEDYFENVMWKEYVNLMEVLAGSDSTSGVPQVALSSINNSCPFICGAKSALHDTLILAYMDAYNSRWHPFCGEVHKPDLHAAAYCMVKLSIIVMAPFTP